jgi:hypothetical protein
MAVDYGGWWAGIPLCPLTAEHVERTVKPVECAVVLPATEVMVHRAAWRQILRHRAPLTSGAQHIHQAVQHLTDIDSPPVATSFGARDLRLGHTPLLVGQVAWVAQLAAIIARGSRQSTSAAPANRGDRDGIRTDSSDSTCSWTDTKLYRTRVAQIFSILASIPALPCRRDLQW